MTSLTRRLFLRNAAVSSAALATVSAPVVVEAAQQELPELLEAGDRLPALVAEFEAATTQRQAARRRFAELAPAVPDDLIVRGPVGRGLGRIEVDCEGKTLWPDDQSKPPRYIYASDLIAEFHGSRFHLRRAHCRHMKRLHGLALEYENGRQAALETSGIEAAAERWGYAEWALHRLSYEVSQMSPRSLTGLIIKTRCVEACANSGPEGNASAAMHSQSLRADIMALFGSTEGRA